MVLLNRITVFFLMFAICFSCSDVTLKQDQFVPVLPLQMTLKPVYLSYALPGLYFQAEGEGFLADANYSAQINVNGQSYPLSVRYVDYFHLTYQIPENSPWVQAFYEGELTTTMSLEGNMGQATTSIRFQFARALTPILEGIDGTSFYVNTPLTIRGNLMFLMGEGDVFIELVGKRFLSDLPEDFVNVQQRFPLTVDISRQSATFIPSLSVFELNSKRFEGSASIIQINRDGSFQSQPLSNLNLLILPPQIEALSDSSITRGQKIYIKGKGFLDEQSNGFSTFSFRGRFVPFNGALREQNFSELPLISYTEAGDISWLVFDPTYDDACDSFDLGANAGILSGELLPYFNYQPLQGNPQSIEGQAFPIEMQIRSPKQLVYLKLLPAFTDSLRLFGLRNVSSQVIDQIITITQNYYQGINIEFTTIEPKDYLYYAVVEIGGPDPNAQQLFGLDNTSGLDHCNQRLDDELAGVNIDGGGFGGVFVESFLQLSPTTHPENPLAHPLFDEIFQPVISQPVQLEELNGARSTLIQRAIDTLAHLVANTLAHEVGHSLGLTTVAGCGSYHSAPGELQMMDCGNDRPFLERAGLDQRGLATWSAEDKDYLQKILPLD